MVTASRNQSSRLRRVGGGLFLVLFGGIFLYFLAPEIVANVAAAGWNTTSCSILSSRVATEESQHAGERETLYRVDVRYSYEVAGHRYESTRYRFIDPFTNGRGSAETAVARNAPGSVVPCYVDPDAPRNAVLDRRLSPFMLIVLLPAAITGLGLWTLAGIGVEMLRG